MFVKKRSGSLSYADDPSGIRSLLSRVSVLHTGGGGGIGQGGAAPPPLLFPRPLSSTQHAHMPDPQHVSVSNAQHAALSSGATQADDDDGDGLSMSLEESAGVESSAEKDAVTGGGGSNDMVHLCATFSADPSIMALAQLLKQMGALQQARALVSFPSTQQSSLQLQQGPVHLQQQQDQQQGGSEQQQVEQHHQQLQLLQQHRSAQQWRSAQHTQSGVLLQFCTSSLYECITAEKAELLASYLKLYVLVLGFTQVGLLLCSIG